MNSIAMNQSYFVSLRTLHPVGKFFIAIFLIVLFEGAIRKWVWGGATIPLLGLRDLIVVGAVFWGILHRYFNFRAWPEILLLFWTVLIVFWSGVQMLSGLMPPIVGAIGFRFWVLYLWFALLCARALSWQDIEYLFKLFSLTLLFMVPLALVQFMSPPTAWINKQAGGEDQFIFQVIKDIVRTTGTFSFTAGYTTYLAFVTPAILWMMSGGLKGTMNPLLRLLIIGLFFVGALVSGSRGTLITTLFFVGMWFLLLLFANKLPKLSPGKILLGVAGFVVLIVLLFPILERSFNANAQRFEDAAHEDVNARVSNMFLGSGQNWDGFEILGYGIGAGANASANFMNSSGFLLGENEFERTLNEGGIIGLFAILLKWMIVLSGLLISWVIFKRNNEFLPLSIWLVLMIQLTTGSVIGQLSIHGFVLLLLGLGFLSLASWDREKKRRLRFQ
ncbi:O-antigen ligase domain-containing protein [uncultured Thiomicrorhabdus sp.]